MCARRAGGGIFIRGRGRRSPLVVVVFLLGGWVRVVVVVGGTSSLLGVGLGGWGRGRERRRRRRWRRLGGGGLVGGVGREVVGRYAQSWAWSTYNEVGMGQGARVVGWGWILPPSTAGSPHGWFLLTSYMA
jgi:hypothetical protein